MPMTQPVSVPLLDLHGQYAPLRAEILEAVTRVCDSQRFIGGPELEAFEREIASALDARHAIGVSSGTDAILACLMALGVGPGDEVITSAYSFFATAGCVARTGARPVLVDIDPATYNIDPAAIARAMTPNTRAIIPVHLYGLMADMDAVMAAAAGIPVIEDACQSIGARYDGCQAGSIGLAGCFSFFPSKNLGAFGDAGLVTTNDDAFAKAVRLMRTHGSERKYYHQKIGGNFRLDAMQAAILRVKAPHLPGWSAARRENANRYHALFAEMNLGGRVVLPVEPPGRAHIYNQFVVRVADRDRVRAELEKAGVGTEVYYPVPFHLQDCFRYLGYREGDFPESERAARETIAIPIYGELSEAQQRHVVASLAKALAA